MKKKTVKYQSMILKTKSLFFLCFLQLIASTAFTQVFTLKGSAENDTIYVSDEFHQKRIFLTITNDTPDTLFLPGIGVTSPQYPFKWVLGVPYWRDDVYEYPDKISRDYSNLESLGISHSPFSLVMVLQYMSNDSLVPYKPFVYVPDYIHESILSYDSIVCSKRFNFQGYGDMFYYSHMRILSPNKRDFITLRCDFSPYNLKKGEYYRFSLFYYVYPSHSGWLEDENLFKNYNTPKHSIQSDEIIVKYE